MEISLYLSLLFCKVAAKQCFQRNKLQLDLNAGHERPKGCN